MIGYKVFDKDLKCRDFQYEVGKTYIKNTPKDKMKCCTDNVFHFCKDFFALERESPYKLSEIRICEIIAGDVVCDGNNYGTNNITILREITGYEKDELINSRNYNSGNYNKGIYNSGNCNNGNHNSGDYNSGNYNSGDYNSGNHNSGNWNSDDYNSGDYNSGFYNSGDWNSGNHNSGSWNSGSYNSGYLNSTMPLIRIFNKETHINPENIIFPDFFYFDLTIFVSYDTASDEERILYKKEIELYGGFHKTISYKDAWRKSWDKATNKDRKKVLKLPNWNNEVFKEISGIDVEKELNIKKIIV